MIIKELYTTRNDGVVLYRTYSDAKKMIHKIDTEEYYAEAIDVETAPWFYEETDMPIEDEMADGAEGEETLVRDGISDTEFRNIVEEAL